MSSQTKALLCEYRYDPVDRLSAQITPGQAAAEHFYHRDHLVTEVKGEQRPAIVQFDDQPLAQQHHTGSGINTALLGTDRQGSELQALTDTASHRFAYTAYGHQSPESGLLSLLGFNGERRDSVTGHYVLGNGYRAFNPALMRFNSPDSWSPFGRGGVNAYVYCLGDPVNHTDPTGHVLASILLKGRTRLQIANDYRAQWRPQVVKQWPAVQGGAGEMALLKGSRPSANLSGSAERLEITAIDGPQKPLREQQNNVRSGKDDAQKANERMKAADDRKKAEQQAKDRAKKEEDQRRERQREEDRKRPGNGGYGASSSTRW